MRIEKCAELVDTPQEIDQCVIDLDMGTTGIDSYVSVSVASRGDIYLVNKVSKKILTGERKVALAA